VWTARAGAPVGPYAHEKKVSKAKAVARNVQQGTPTEDHHDGAETGSKRKAPMKLKAHGTCAACGWLKLMQVIGLYMQVLIYWSAENCVIVVYR
jgi:hypothetical protein